MPKSRFCFWWEILLNIITILSNPLSVINLKEKCIYEPREYLMHWLDAWIFTASVRITEITSNDPPRTRLSARSGSYSHMALAVSTAPIFVIWLMTVMFARLTTWAKHLLQTCDLFLTFVTLSLFLCLSSVYFLFTLSLSLFIHALERSRLHPFHIFIIISHVTYLLSHAYDISHVNRYHMPIFYHMLLYLLRL